MELVIHDAGYWRTTTFGDSTVHWKDSLGHVAAELETTSVDALAQSARKQRGNWAAIVEAGGKIHLVTDAARSYPIHYAALGDTLHVSSRMEDFRGAVPYRRNEQATREFLHSGWVLGSDTLIEGVSTVRSSTIHTFDAPGSSAEHPYIDYVPSARLEESSADYLSRFASALRRSYLDLLEAAGDRQLIVPLSGGVDSRIQLAVLADVGAPHVATFTYGRPDSAEARVSKEIAKQAGRPWFFIETTEDAIGTTTNSSSTHGLVMPSPISKTGLRCESSAPLRASTQTESSSPGTRPSRPPTSADSATRRHPCRVRTWSNSSPPATSTSAIGHARPTVYRHFHRIASGLETPSQTNSTSKSATPSTSVTPCAPMKMPDSRGRYRCVQTRSRSCSLSRQPTSKTPHARLTDVSSRAIMPSTWAAIARSTSPKPPSQAEFPDG